MTGVVLELVCRVTVVSMVDVFVKVDDTAACDEDTGAYDHVDGFVALALEEVQELPAAVG